MYLKKISLFNYKNFSEANFEFDGKIICFVGKNGIGKTNVLDAIYHLSYGKSYFNPLAVQNIKHGEEFFVIDGEFEKNDRTEQIVCSLKKGQKKILKRNGKQYDKFSDHIGFIPLVIISPADRDLIVEGSETRRKFMDSVISQLDSQYLKQCACHRTSAQEPHRWVRSRSRKSDPLLRHASARTSSLRARATTAHHTRRHIVCTS